MVADQLLSEVDHPLPAELGCPLSICFGMSLFVLGTWASIPSPSYASMLATLTLVSPRTKGQGGGLLEGLWCPEGTSLPPCPSETGQNQFDFAFTPHLVMQIADCKLYGFRALCFKVTLEIYPHSELGPSSQYKLYLPKMMLIL